MSRIPAVANMFYPGDKGRLEDQLRAFLKPVSEPKEVLAAISPHAGYVYSGRVAGSVRFCRAFSSRLPMALSDMRWLLDRP